MSFWHFLNHWWNFPYLVMLGLVGVFFVLQIVGFATHAGDADADADHDFDHDHDVAVEHDQDVAVDHDHDLDHDHDVDADGDGDDHGDAQGDHAGLLSFLGIGRVPFLVVWMTLFIFAGFSGLFVNRVLFVKSGDQYPFWGFPLALLAALLCGGVATRFTARLVGKLVDVGGKGAPRRRELQGRWGVVASASVDNEFGEVRVRDERGQELLVHGRVQAGGRALAQGERVLLLEFDERTELYLVEKFEPESSGSKKSERAS
jgi:membrane protein implicated in regulation of membrane protease activity